jgi:hypothetical protein
MFFVDDIPFEHRIAYSKDVKFLRRGMLEDGLSTHLLAMHIHLHHSLSPNGQFCLWSIDVS